MTATLAVQHPWLTVRSARWRCVLVLVLVLVARHSRANVVSPEKCARHEIEDRRQPHEHVHEVAQGAIARLTADLC